MSGGIPLFLIPIVILAVILCFQDTTYRDVYPWEKWDWFT